MKIIKRDGIKYRAITGKVTKELLNDRSNAVSEIVKKWAKETSNSAG